MMTINSRRAGITRKSAHPAFIALAPAWPSVSRRSAFGGGEAEPEYALAGEPGDGAAGDGVCFGRVSGIPHPPQKVEPAGDEAPQSVQVLTSTSLPCESQSVLDAGKSVAGDSEASNQALPPVSHKLDIYSTLSS